MARKLAKIIGLLLGLLIVALIGFIFLSGPSLPAATNDILDEVLSEELPSFVTGTSGTVQSDGYDIWYEARESSQDSTQGTFLLFMGISNDALGWPEPFLQQLTDGGYRLVRFDYRGTGMSDWADDWQEKPYDLSNLSADAMAILDMLEIEKVHVLGVSLGGMVAQQFSLQYPARTISLISMMSTGDAYDGTIPPVSAETAFSLVRSSLKYGLLPGERNKIKVHLAARIVLRGEADYELDMKTTAQQVLYNHRHRNGYNPHASAQHHEATRLSGSRYEALQSSAIPTLLIHGKQDPFIPVEHSMKLDSLIPNSTALLLDNMGHDLPESKREEVVNEILGFVQGLEEY